MYPNSTCDVRDCIYYMPPDKGMLMPGLVLPPNEDTLDPTRIKMSPENHMWQQWDNLTERQKWPMEYQYLKSLN